MKLYAAVALCLIGINAYAEPMKSHKDHTQIGAICHNDRCNGCRPFALRVDYKKVKHCKAMIHKNKAIASCVNVDIDKKPAIVGIVCKKH